MNDYIASKPEIMVVDDKENNLTAMKVMLNDLPIKVVTAISGNDCLQKLINIQPFLILMDVNMPDMNGYETAEIIRTENNTKNIPIIFVTASDKDKTNVFNGYESGAVDFLFKPVDQNILESKVKVFLDLNLQTKELEAEIIKRKSAEMELLTIATHDILTGLPNRKLFMDRIEQTIIQAERQPQCFALLFIDLDGFKQINDTFGHKTGDNLLVLVSDTLKECIRKSDTLARLGGDEFTVILTNLQHENAASNITKNIITAITNITELDGHKINVGASIGISLFPKDGDNAEDVMRNADIAMYAVKNIGKNNFLYFSKDMHNPAAEQMHLSTDLKKAWENKEFIIHYQPIVNYNLEIVSCEALIRRDNKEAGLQDSTLFINEIEKSGLIIPIGAWLIDMACKQQASWQAELNKNITVSINVSAVQISEKTFINKIQAILDASAISANNLILEITESQIINESKKMLEILEDLNAMGVKIALDDFGTGNLSLYYLKNFPLDILKIDKSFIAGLSANRNDRIIVESTIKLARDLGMTIVAKGVENKPQLERLYENKCELVQGEYFHKAAAVQEINALLSK